MEPGLELATSLLNVTGGGCFIVPLQRNVVCLCVRLICSFVFVFIRAMSVCTTACFYPSD